MKIVEDDESVRTTFKRLLSANGFDVEVFALAEEFLRSGRLQDSRCLVLDVQLREMSGVELQH